MPRPLGGVDTNQIFFFPFFSQFTDLLAGSLTIPVLTNTTQRQKDKPASTTSATTSAYTLARSSPWTQAAPDRQCRQLSPSLPPHPQLGSPSCFFVVTSVPRPWIFLLLLLLFYCSCHKSLPPIANSSLVRMDGALLLWSNRPAPPVVILLKLYWPPLPAPYRLTEPSAVSHHRASAKRRADFPQALKLSLFLSK